MNRLRDDHLRVLLASIGFVVIIAGLLMAGSDSGSSSESKVSEEGALLPVVHIKKVVITPSYQETNAFIGRVEAGQLSQLAFEFAGLLKSVNVDEGDNVNAGDTLARLDTDRLRAQLAELNAALDRAKAQKALAEARFVRIEASRRANAVSVQEEDEARELRDTAIANYQVARSQLDRVSIDFRKGKIIAPYDGTIVGRFADPGTVINAGSPMLSIQEQDSLKIRVGVTASIASQLAIGSQQTLFIGETNYAARVLSVLPVRDEGRVVDVLLGLTTKESGVRPGTVVRLPMTKTINKSGYWVPLNALIEGDRGIWSVYIISNASKSERVVRRHVEIIYTKPGFAFISGELKDDDLIVLSGASKLVPGQQVKTRMENSDV